MQPTDSTFIWLVISVTALILLATILWVPRLWKKGVWKYLTQGISVLLTTLLVLLTTAVILNAQNSWFPSWASLTGSPSNESVAQQTYGVDTRANNTAHVHSISTGKPTALQANIASNPVLGPKVPQDTSQGAYMTFNVRGEVSGESHDVLAWLPASYFQNSNRFYPVIMAFPGFPGSLDAYVKDLEYGNLVNDAVAAGDMQDAIVIVPDVMHGNNDTECVDGTKSSGGTPAPKIETFVAKDLVSWVQQNLRTINHTGAWATSGYSAGGWCSSMFAVRHPDIFGASLNQSGYFSPIYSSKQEWNDPKDPRYLLGKRVQEDRPRIDIYFFASDDDPLAMDDLPDFVSAVKPPTSLLVETIPVGGHRPDVWVVGIELGLKHLGSDLKYFAPIQ
ncbi:alpha/beta hydrolase-fold protein [uncultured Rothia sp.]|uniref:alpha/beta hydrolase n=1 Tax=uncultured Rothia sp. TaxID=316088 RepID=UPI003217DE2F